MSKLQSFGQSKHTHHNSESLALLFLIYSFSPIPLQVLKKLNRDHEACLQFSWALDFSRSGSSSQLREEIDQAYHNQNSLDLGSDADTGFLPLGEPSIEGGEGSFEEGELGESDGSMRSD